MIEYAVIGYINIDSRPNIEIINFFNTEKEARVFAKEYLKTQEENKDDAEWLDLTGGTYESGYELTRIVKLEEVELI